MEAPKNINLKQTHFSHASSIKNQCVSCENEFKFKALYLAKCAHEIKNILISISSFIENNSIVIKQKNSSFNEEENINFLKSLCDFGMNLIFEINKFAKKESGFKTEKNEDFNLINCLKFCLRIFQSRCIFEKKKIEIKSDFKISNKKKINSINEIKLKQVIINLLSNSYKFTIKGFIKLSVKEINEKIRISVSDSGVGFNKDEIDKICNPFMVINRNQHLNKFGSGLGLSIIKEILEENNSFLHIKSKKGEGSEFYFDLNDTDNNIFDPFSFFDNSIKEIIKDINSGKKDNFKKDNNDNNDEVYKKKSYKHSKKKSSKSILQEGFKRRSSLLIRKISNDNLGNLDIANIANNNNNNLILNNNLLSYNNLDQGSNLTRSMCVIGETEIKKNREFLFTRTNKFRILICDDDNLSSLSTRNIIIKYYKNQNKETSLPEIYFAQNGIECLYSVYTSFIRDDPIDLVLIDKNMPFIDGVTTSTLIKNVIELSDVKIYILSSENVDLEDCKVDGYYDKPISNEALNQILSEKKEL